MIWSLPLRTFVRRGICVFVRKCSGPAASSAALSEPELAGAKSVCVAKWLDVVLDAVGRRRHGSRLMPKV